MGALAIRLQAEQQARLKTEEQAAALLAEQEGTHAVLEARIRELEAKLWHTNRAGRTGSGAPSCA